MILDDIIKQYLNDIYIKETETTKWTKVDELKDNIFSAEVGTFVTSNNNVIVYSTMKLKVILIVPLYSDKHNS